MTGSKDKKDYARRLARVRNKPLPTLAGSANPAVSVRRGTSDSSIVVIDQLIKRFVPNPQKLRDRIQRTGLKLSIARYLLFCGVLFVIVSIAGLLAMPALLSILVGVIIGMGIPHFVLGFLARRRLNKFTLQFPEAIDLMVRGLKSGLPVSESIRAVGHEMPDPIGIEFRQVTDSIQLGQTMNEALWAAAARLDSAEFRFFNITLGIQQETGGNLSETLDNLSRVIRSRKQMKLKIKAYSSEAKASAYIIGSLPFVMFGIIYTTNPEYAGLLFSDFRGLVMVGISFVLYLIGITVMVKMVKFDI